MARFAQSKRKRLLRFLNLSNGFPSHDRPNAIFAAIKPAEFAACRLRWIGALHEITDGQILAAGGKTRRGSLDAASRKSAIHMIRPWATACHIRLRQVIVDDKSNGITAIPKLRKTPGVSGCLLTIDAMDCQTELAQTILVSGADYELAVKKNQPTLYDAIS